MDILHGFGKCPDFRQIAPVAVIVHAAAKQIVGATLECDVVRPIGRLMFNSLADDHRTENLLRAYGLPVAQSDILTFGRQKVLSVKRFDRQLHPDGSWYMRLPQEDFCQTMGCSDSGCLAELAGAVGAAYVVSGTISKSGETYTISLVLTDQQKAQALDRVVREESNLAKVGDAVRVAAQRVVAKLLENKKGNLRLVVGEKGADVKIDDVLIGTTPLPPQALPMGPHKISVEKTGFIAFRQEIFLKPQEDTTLTGTLIPLSLIHI